LYKKIKMSLKNNQINFTIKISITMKKKIAILSLMAIFVSATALTAQTTTQPAKAKTEACCKDKKAGECCKNKATAACCKNKKAGEKACTKSEKSCDKKTDAKK